MTPFEGMASGAVAAALCWDGIEYIYPEEAVMDSLEEIAARISSLNREPRLYEEAAKRGQKYVRENYDIEPVWAQIRDLLDFGGDYEEFCH